MSNYNQITNQDVEHINDEESFENMPNENRALFKCALSEDMEMPPPSRRHKIRMNRLFREHVGGSFLPFPEADNLYERLRSRLIIKFKINEFLDRREERRRER